ncbi:VOC family protein [Mycolicibacterium phocaicum]|uniref:VOC family protein n=1 Tax=Mycolicibacterium phocaicum TaxID=319706 RepID=UPI001CFAEB18|nr:VOC family protein [Mycolicibacterium phocaicum]UCZ59952.1 VOC family protein [Mycolicibacterium phocaicum]
MDMKFEIAVLPVSDVDRAKDFYEKLGWRLDADFETVADFRVIQLTPPGSGASVIFGTGVSDAVPGSVGGLHLVVDDVVAARAELVGRGITVSEVFHDEGGVFHRAGTAGRVDGPDPERRSYASYASFEDPDGNGWVLQEITTRLPGR